MATYSVDWSAVLASTVTNVAVGTCLVMDSTGFHWPGTSTNRTSYGRTMGICAGPGDASNRSVQMIEAGLIPPSITGLAAGAVSWVRASTAGLLERCTPGVGDDLVGQCHADGSLQFAPGVWDSTNFAGGGGGGGGATLPINLAGGAGTVTGVLPTANQAPQTLAGDATGTTAASVVARINGATVPAAGSLTTGNVLQVSGASADTYGPVNLAGGSNYVTGALPAANQAAAGTTPQFLWNSSGTPAGSAGFKYDLSTTQARCSPNCGILFRNVADTFDGRVFWNVSAAQTIVFPDATGTVVLQDSTDTLTNKTIVLASNTLTDTSATTGDILRHNGTRFVRLARGSANQVLTTNAGATDISWATPATSSPPTGVGFWHNSSAGVMDAAAVSLTWTGDATGTGTGTSFALTVVKVNGATVPAAGALTTGNAAYVSGVSALTYSALNLAGGTGWVTGALPLGNQAAPTGSGFAHVTSAAWDAASIKVDTTNSAHVTVPGTANGVVTVVSGALTQPSNVLASAGMISLGANPPTTGTALNIGGTGAAANIYFRDNGNTADIKVLERTTSNVPTLGDLSYNTQVQGFNLVLDAANAGGIDTAIAGQYCIQFTSTSINVAQPIIGDTRAPSPYSVHGEVSDATAPPFTVAAATYAYDAIKLTNAGAGNVTFPLPASAAASYYKTIINTGNGTKTITNGGGSTWGLVTNSLVRLLFDTSGVHLVSAVVAYP